jgi:uncharacterized protein YijF (DUF1287 family)
MDGDPAGPETPPFPGSQAKRRFRCVAMARPSALTLLLLLSAPAAANGQNAAPSFGERLAHAAEAQVGVTLHYDPAYVRLAYPGGDVPIERGVCTDVVVRALRAVGVDLQVAVHEDMRRDFAAYPRLWGLRRPDRNIDHRRVPNLMTFLGRRGKQLALTAPYDPGDLVAWRLANGLHHVGVVSSRTAPGGDHRLVVHNIGAGAQLEDVLHAFEKLGHYRW